MNIVEFTKQFHDMEASRGLFELVDEKGTHYWDLARFQVFYHVYSKLSGSVDIYRQPKVPALPKRLVKKAISSLFQLVVLGLVFIRKKETLLVQCSRTRVGAKYRDFIMEQLSFLRMPAVLAIETSPYRRSLLNTRYLFSYSQLISCDQLAKGISMIEEEVEERFGIHVNLAVVISDSLRVHYCEFSFYERLIRLSGIKRIFVVQNGIQKALFRAASINGVECNEFQHGYIGYPHPLYSYPDLEFQQGQLQLPGRLLIYSGFWLKGFSCPIQEKLVIGSQNHEVPLVRGKFNGRVLVVSSALHHENLQRLVCTLARMSKDIHFTYKLHPNQFLLVDEIRDEFSAFMNVEVVSDERNVSSCLKTDKHVLCIQSTVVYEALQSGSYVYCYRKQDSNAHDNALEAEGFEYFDDADEFLAIYAHNCDHEIESTPEYFGPFDFSLVRRKFGTVGISATAL